MSVMTPLPKTAGEFNRRFPVGTPVYYWPGATDGEYHESATRTPAWEMPSGSAVVSIEGYPGGIALTHISVREVDL